MRSKPRATRCSASAAAGVQLAADGVERFRDAFRQAAAEQQPSGAGVKGPQADVRLDPRDDLMQVVADLERVEPCGEANPAPKLLIEEVRVLEARPIKGHLKLQLDVRGQRLSGFGPDLGHLAGDLPSRMVTVVGKLRRDHWRGGRQPEILVTGIEASREG
jgi:single-stranded-DNA-specific exonuclease